VIDMTDMFRNASSFNQDISSWKTPIVRFMDRMFMDAVAFNQDLSDWDLQGVAFLARMFQGALSFKQDLCDWGSRIRSVQIDQDGDGQFTNMFANTSCPLENEPDPALTPLGPFCHSCV
jgi:surface protein